MIVVTHSWHNPNPNTIWNKLVARLGREPTKLEVYAELDRIIAGAPAILPHHGEKP